MAQGNDYETVQSASIKRLPAILAVCILVLSLSDVNAFSVSSSGSTSARVSLSRRVIESSVHRHSRIPRSTVSKVTTALPAANVSNDHGKDHGLFQKKQGLRQAFTQFRDGMMKVLSSLSKWKNLKQFKSLMLAAILSFSMFTVSQNTVQNYVDSGAATTIPAIERVQPNLNPRGGSSAVSTSDRYHDFSIFRPKSKSIAETIAPKQSKLRKNARGVEDGIAQAGKATGRTIKEALNDLGKYMRGPKSDTLIVLLATALITPLCKRMGTNPILGFLASGMLLGPNGFGFIRGIHTTEVFAELGIVFFLFEMGIELSVERLMQMRKDVFGLGLGQFLISGLAVGLAGGLLGLPANAQVVVGGGLALSSSAFVLQLLKDKNQLATRFGKAAFGILLFQDLAVVPLLVVTPILAGGGSGLVAAVGSAVLKAGLALGSIAFAGRYLLNGLFRTVAAAKSQEAFLGLVLLTVLSMSFMTEGLGLSNTLGAFLAGVMLSDTKYRYQVEADIAPFRGILLGLFFVTVGYEIDVRLIASQLPVVGGLVFGILALKTAITTALSLAFGLSLPTSLQTGMILSQGGEFAFVAFGLARSLGILDAATTKLLLTSASLTMALTPFLATFGAKLAKKLEEDSDFTHYLGQDTDATEIKNSDKFAVVVGYGTVGKTVCNLLDRKLIKYVGLEVDPNKAIQARNSGLPVFYGDIGRPEVAEAFNVGKANIVVVCIADKQQATRVVIALRRQYPDLKIFCRAVDADHRSRLQNTLNVAAMVPMLPEDTQMMTLPFGAAVMRTLGVSAEEVTAIVESKKREILAQRSSLAMDEEAMLAQLGIENTDEEDPDLREKMNDKAAAEQRSKVIEKSPFVAEVIEDACPESICITDEDDDSEVVDAEIVSEVDLPQPEEKMEVIEEPAGDAIPATVAEASESSITHEEPKSESENETEAFQ